MKHLAPLALFSLLATLATLAACGVAPEEAQQANGDGDARELVAPVVLNIGIEQLAVARFDLDLERNIGRFTGPASAMPLDRVSIFADGEVPEDLDNAIARCNELWGYEITGGAEFVVGQGETNIAELNTGSCVACGFAVICPGSCPNLGPGEVPRGDPSTWDTDPPDGDTGVDNGGSDGSSGDGSSGSSGGHTGGNGSTSGSGAGSGGSGGTGGGVGNPGGEW